MTEILKYGQNVDCCTQSVIPRTVVDKKDNRPPVGEPPVGERTLVGENVQNDIKVSRLLLSDDFQCHFHNVAAFSLNSFSALSQTLSSFLLSTFSR